VRPTKLSQRTPATPCSRRVVYQHRHTLTSHSPSIPWMTCCWLKRQPTCEVANTLAWWRSSNVASQWLPKPAIGPPTVTQLSTLRSNLRTLPTIVPVSPGCCHKVCLCGDCFVSGCPRVNQGHTRKGSLGRSWDASTGLALGSQHQVVVYETIWWKDRTKLLMSSSARRLGSACLVTIRK
jgi:hypothetical protein